MERNYPSDLSDGQWQKISRLLPKKKKRGRKPLDRRAVLNAILYVVRTGCQWRSLPKDFPKWKSFYTVFWRWRNQGVWEEVHDALRGKVRKKDGRKPTPTAAIVDSQSVNTTEVGGDQRGYNAGKKVNGCKRHIVVDTMGLLLAVVVHAADIQDQDGAKTVLSKLAKGFRRLKVVFGDSAYGRSGLPNWLKSQFNKVLQPVLRPVGVKGFVVLPKRWVVERSFGWLGRWRRHSKDYERNPKTSAAMIYISMIAMMARRRDSPKS